MEKTEEFKQDLENRKQMYMDEKKTQEIRLLENIQEKRRGIEEDDEIFLL